VHARLRLESVMEGVLVSGEVDAPLAGSCARCLEDRRGHPDLDVQELYAYEGSTTEETSDEDEVRLVEGEFIDLEPMLRDAVVLSLPLAPVCDEDCAGCAPAAVSGSTTSPTTTRTSRATRAGPVSPSVSRTPRHPRRGPRGELTWPSRSGRCPAPTPAPPSQWKATRPPCRRARTACGQPQAAAPGLPELRPVRGRQVLSV
jgi:hypothetical protein